MKKTGLIYVITLFLCIFRQNAVADVLPGSWKIHPSFVPYPVKVIETDSKVYYLNGGSLFSYDFKNEESRSYVYSNPLSDWNITGIYYSNDNKCLLIAYENGNIDLIDKKGEIINIPDIKEGSDIDDKSIFGVAFNGKTAFIATGFGLVSIDLEKGKIKDSGKFGDVVESVAVFGDNLYIVTDGQLFTLKNDQRINKLDNFSSCGQIRAVDEIYPIAADNLMIRTAKLISFGKIDNSGFNEYDWLEILDKPLVYGDVGVYAVLADNRLWRIAYDGTRDILRDFPAVENDEAIGGKAMENDYWSLTREGLLRKSFSDGRWISQGENMLPADALTTRSIDFIIPGVDESRIYFGNLGATLYRNGATDALETLQELSLLENGSFSDKSATGVEAEFHNARLVQGLHGPWLVTPQRFCEDPADKDTYYIGTGNDGLYKIKNRQFAGRYAAGNSPISHPWGYRVFEVSIDRGGNLWVGYDGTGQETGVAVLPPDKRLLDPADVAETDWTEIDLKGMPVDRDMRIFHCRKSPVTVIFNWNGNDGLIIYNNGNTPADLSDDRVIPVSRIYDQDGHIFLPQRFTSIAEDSRGFLWIGCEGGMIVIDNPGDINDSQITVKRLKIAHDDGTGLADYFCASDRILDISVDQIDRKWVATAESGVYLLNKDGNAIIENFTSDNSPIPSNGVKSVYADPLSNSVFFGTRSGLLEYGSEVSRSEDSLNGVKVYPNPVTPETPVDFVTISGLADGTEIKIVNAAGALIWQGRSEGGMARWSLQTISGKRVATGVYYLLLSSDTAGTSSAKIMIIN